MKKQLSFFLAMVLLMGLLCGCQRTPGQDPTESAPDTPLEILQTVWESYGQDKFSAYGGDSDHIVDGAPGEFSTEDDYVLQYSLMVPENQVNQIQQAASLIHGMMVNNFTCGAFRLTEGTDTKAFAGAMAESMRNNQWICGLPEQFAVATVGDSYVVSVFGGELLTDFLSRLKTAYPNTQILYQEAVAR